MSPEMGWRVMQCVAVQGTPSPWHLGQGEGYPELEIDERKARVETGGLGRGVGARKSASRSVGDQEYGWHLCVVVGSSMRRVLRSCE